MLNLPVVFITAILVAISLQSRQNLPVTRGEIVNEFLSNFDELKGDDNVLTLDEALARPDKTRSQYIRPNGVHLSRDLRAFRKCMFNKLNRDNTMDGTDHEVMFDRADRDNDEQVTSDEFNRYARGLHAGAAACYRKSCL